MITYSITKIGQKVSLRLANGLTNARLLTFLKLRFNQVAVVENFRWLSRVFMCNFNAPFAHTMDLTTFLEKPCRFRLRSGKEVFGVIWNDLESAGLRFASSRDFSLLRQATEAAATAAPWYPLDRDDIIAAQLLDNVMVA